MTDDSLGLVGLSTLVTSNLEGRLSFNLSSSIGCPIITEGRGATVLGVEIVVAVLLVTEVEPYVFDGADE